MTVETGTICDWLPKGFGFIKPEFGGVNVFVHINNTDSEFDDIPKGTRVRYEIGPGKKPGTTQAVNVRLETKETQT